MAGIVILQDPALHVLELYLKYGLREIEISVMIQLVDEATIRAMFHNHMLTPDWERDVFIIEDELVAALRDGM